MNRHSGRLYLRDRADLRLWTIDAEDLNREWSADFSHGGVRRDESMRLAHLVCVAAWEDTGVLKTEPDVSAIDRRRTAAATGQ